MTRPTHKQRVLDLLRDGAWHSHVEGYRLGVMLHSRVADLRRDGHVIECRRNGELYEYRLVTVPVEAPVSEPGQLVLTGPTFRRNAA